MRGRTGAFAAPAGHSASLDDYINFHGMKCHPQTAQRCITSFTGTVLFMPEHYSQSTIARYDCSGGILNLWSYYLLVIFSFTGLSTMCKQTKFLVAENVPVKEQAFAVEDLVSMHNPQLKVDQNVMNYVMKQTSSSSLKLVRKFEYHFGSILPVSVIMFHFRCNNGLLHLVEVYQVERGRHLFAFITDTLGEAIRWAIGKKHVKEN
jgi:hypothetical protein